MASLRILVAIAIVAAVVVPSLATEFVVGDDKVGPSTLIIKHGLQTRNSMLVIN